MKEKRALKKDEKAIKEKQNKEELININRLRQKERKRSKKEKGTKR